MVHSESKQGNISNSAKVGKIGLYQRETVPNRRYLVLRIVTQDAPKVNHAEIANVGVGVYADTGVHVGVSTGVQVGVSTGVQVGVI